MLSVGPQAAPAPALRVLGRPRPRGWVPLWKGPAVFHPRMLLMRGKGRCTPMHVVRHYVGMSGPCVHVRGAYADVYADVMGGKGLPPDPAVGTPDSHPGNGSPHLPLGPRAGLCFFYWRPEGRERALWEFRWNPRHSACQGPGRRLENSDQARVEGTARLRSLSSGEVGWAAFAKQKAGPGWPLPWAWRLASSLVWLCRASFWLDLVEGPQVRGSEVWVRQQEVLGTGSQMHLFALS